MPQSFEAGQRVMLWRDLPDDGPKAGALGVVALAQGNAYGVVFDNDGKSGHIRVDILLGGIHHRILDLCGPTG